MKFDWTNIETVLLDMDGTLLDLHFDSHFWRNHLPQVIATKNGIQLDEALASLEPIFLDHAGTLNWYCVNFWSQQLGFDIMPHKREVANKIAYRESAEEFLQRCNQHTQDVRMVTNAHRKVLELKIELTQIDQYFPQMLCSHELGHPKEEVEFWQKLHQHTPFNPATTLLIDDNEAVLESAERHGIKHLYSIAQPDSSTPRHEESRFPMIKLFV